VSNDDCLYILVVELEKYFDLYFFLDSFEIN
jgi:hypothetical protein